MPVSPIKRFGDVKMELANIYGVEADEIKECRLSDLQTVLKRVTGTTRDESVSRYIKALQQVGYVKLLSDEELPASKQILRLDGDGW